MRDYEDLVAWHTIKHKGAIPGLFGIRGTFTIIKRKDIDNCLTTLLDCLQKSGVIRNDNDCFEVNIKKVAIKPKEEESCDVELYPLE